MSVSVIIPTHNYGRFLKEAIASVQNQTVGESEVVEIIVIDDGSTDETPAVLESIQDPRLQVIRFDCNQGVSVARNLGMKQAQGEFIAFLDADDRWRPTKLEEQLTVIRSEPKVGLVFSDIVRFRNQEFFPRSNFQWIPEFTQLPTRPSRQGRGHVVTGDTFSELIRLALLASLPSTSLLRSEVAKKVTWPIELHICEDLYYFLGIYRLTQAAFIDEPLVEMRRHGNNSYSSGLEVLEHSLEAVSLFLLEGEPLPSRHRRCLLKSCGRRWASLGYYHFWAGAAAPAMKAYLQSLRYPGSRGNALKHLALIPVLPLIPGKTSREEEFDTLPTQPTHTSAPHD